MDLKELEAVIKLEPAKRYKYFIKKICDYEELWVLHSKENGYAVNESKEKLYLYLFPLEEYALFFQKKEMAFPKYTPMKIDIYFFKDELINKFILKNVKESFVFPVPNGFGYNVPLDELKADIEKELRENY